MIRDVLDFIIDYFFTMSTKMNSSIDLTIKFWHVFGLLDFEFLGVNCDVEQFGKDCHFMFDFIKVSFDYLIVSLDLFCLW